MALETLQKRRRRQGRRRCILVCASGREIENQQTHQQQHRFDVRFTISHFIFSEEGRQRRRWWGISSLYSRRKEWNSIHPWLASGGKVAAFLVGHDVASSRKASLDSGWACLQEHLRCQKAFPHFLRRWRCRKVPVTFSFLQQVIFSTCCCIICITTTTRAAQSNG